MKDILVIFILLLVLGGCAEYQFGSRSATAQVHAISTDTFEVNFCGNAYMTEKEVERYAMQRASDLVLSKGFSHFIVAGRKDASRVCQLSYRLPAVPKTDMPTYMEYEPFYVPNITLVIRAFNRGSEMPEHAIDAAAYLQMNFPGLGS